MKRLLAAILVFIIILSIVVPVIAASNYDSAGRTLKNLGILKGDEKGNLMLNQSVKRQDMVVMLSRLYKEENKAKNHAGRNNFSDLDSSRKFYAPYVSWAQSKSLIKGMEEDEFGFNRNVTVQEFQAVLLRVLGYGHEASNWSSVPALAKKLGIMDGLNLNPSSNLTRGQFAAMTLNALKQNKKSMSLTLGEILGLRIPR